MANEEKKPTYVEIGNAGEITGGQSGQTQFIPKHTGTIDREPIDQSRWPGLLLQFP